jgi:hypothetical protein
MRALTRTAKSLGVTIAAALAIFGLSACGQFEKGFNASFDKKTHDSCLPAAMKNGLSADAAEKYCTCAVAKLDKLSLQDKMSLQSHPERLQAAADACRPT